MILIVRHGFGIKTDLFETNVLNLAVVVGIVVTFVGDALTTLLNQRRQIILSTLQEADQKARKVQRRLDEARKSVETARLRAQEIRSQSVQDAEQENFKIQQQLQDDLSRLKESRRQRIQLERQRRIKAVSQQVTSLTLANVENSLLTAFRFREGSKNSKQLELNEMHVRDTFRQFEKLFSL